MIENPPLRSATLDTSKKRLPTPLNKNTHWLSSDIRNIYFVNPPRFISKMARNPKPLTDKPARGKHERPAPDVTAEPNAAAGNYISEITNRYAMGPKESLPRNPESLLNGTSATNAKGEADESGIIGPRPTSDIC